MVAAMARSGDQASEIWGTWEELLLACAVNRHGTRSWDSVAMEVQSRSPASAQLLTPQSCCQRYRDLQRRFGVDGACDDPAPEVPWLEELRKLRVAELRREVERYDVSIGSLQLKVKRLKEERERSLPETTAGEGVPDPKDEEMRDAGSPGSTPETCGGERISAGDSGRSCKESNSTDPKEDEGKAGGEDGKLEEASASDGGELDPVVVRDEKPAGEGSYNGSSDTIAKGAVAPASSAAADVDAARPRLGESGESVAESKEGEKESSDVQSSASLSKRRRRGRRRKAVSGSSSAGGGEGREAGEVSKCFAAESQPLVAFLEIIRSQDYGSVFESRLESQECARYRSLIRRHVDLEMVRSKIERGAYTSVEFFRDLLLLCTNAIVFYNKGSPEYSAAVRLRELVAKEMSLTIRKSPPPIPPAVEAKDPPPRLPPEPPLLAPKLNLDPDIKPENKRYAPLIACKKRSSISAKPSAPLPAIVAGAKEERDEKRDVDRKEQEGEGEGVDQGLALKKTGERSGTRGLRSNKSRGGSRGGAAILKSPIPAPAPAPTATPTPTQSVSPPVPAESPAKSAKKSGGAAAALSMAKKRDAATFLNRITGKPRTSNGVLLGTLKGQSSGSGSGSVQKKASGVKGDGRKEQVSRSKPAPSSASKRSLEQGAPVKRSVGRPPKRAAPPPVPPPAKRAREEVDHAAPSKKKGRK